MSTQSDSTKSNTKNKTQSTSIKGAGLFSTLNLPQAMLDNLNSLGFKSMTEVQAQALPVILSGADLIAKAKTGSGKTVAFSIDMVSRINPRFFGCQALVLCPTRELAGQVADEIRKLARTTQNIKVLTLCGGMPIGPQIGSLEKGAHIVVGTPGRIQDHLRKRTLDISQVETFVLDEADRMLDMGFRDEMKMIANHILSSHQTLLFSATFPDEIEVLSSEFQQDPVVVEVESVHTSNKIDQKIFKVEKGQRTKGLVKLVQHLNPKHAVVFCNTKNSVNEVVDLLKGSGYSALALEGDMEQRQRDETLVRFANRSTSILVATDVAARGLDIDDIEVVINFDLPRDPEVYVHRIGRTGRGDKSGIAASLFLGSEKFLYDKILKIQNGIDLPITDLNSVKVNERPPEKPEMVTILLDGGKKMKIRPGDILGALTGDMGFDGSKIGKIKIFPFKSYVAVHRQIARQVLEALKDGKVKGKNLRVKRL